MQQKEYEVVSQANEQLTHRPENDDINVDLISRNKDQKNSRIYKLVTTLYCIFLAIVGFIIVLAPQSWLSIPAVVKVINTLAGIMPGLVRLANLSGEPQVVMFGYILAFLTMPIHVVALTIVVVSRFNNGFITEKFAMNQLKWPWLVMLGTWVYFFTCLFCEQDPGWRDYLIVSNRVWVATLSQFLVAANSIYPGIILTAIIIALRRKRSQHSGEENHGSN